MLLGRSSLCLVAIYLALTNGSEPITKEFRIIEEYWTYTNPRHP